MSIPNRIKEYIGRYALVDGIPYAMPIQTAHSQAFMVGFYCDFAKAAALLPGNELHPLRLWNGKAVFIVTVVNYTNTTIGKYIEYRLAIAVTRGPRPATRILPAIFMDSYNTGQFLLDLPVSTEIAIKAGKGVWGFPKHHANLDFNVGDRMISSQYEADGEFAFRIEFERPSSTNFPLNIGAVNYSHFRNMLIASHNYFNSKAGLRLGKKALGNVYIGDSYRTAYMRDLKLESKPFFTLFMPDLNGILDDYVQSWFVTYPTPPSEGDSEGLESVIRLGQGQEWLEPPSITDYERFKI